MIVWGGYSGTYLNSGGRYDPTTNAWTATSTGANLPNAREDHRAVWTGTEMIVWGGFTSVSPTYLNTGGRERPAMGRLTAQPTRPDRPRRRSRPTPRKTRTVVG